MNTNTKLIIDFLGVKSIPQKASNDTRSTTKLDYKNIEFPDHILPTTADWKHFPFDNDWNWIMIVVQHIWTLGVNLQINERSVFINYGFKFTSYFQKRVECNNINKLKCLYEIIIEFINFYNAHPEFFIENIKDYKPKI